MTAVRTVAIRCPGGYVGEAVSATGFLRIACRELRCRAPDGSRPVHVFDLATGWMVNERQNEAPETAHQEGT